MGARAKARRRGQSSCGHSGNDTRQETVEVAHEALIRNWPTLVDWVNRDRVFISWRNQLKQRLDDWRVSPDDEGTLLRGGPLAVAEEWAARRGADLNEEEKAFISKGIEFRDAETRKADAELQEKQARLKEVAEAQGKTAQAQQERAAAQEKTEQALDEASRAQQRARWALGTIAGVIVLAGALLWFLYSTESSALQHQHANLLGELADAQLAGGDPHAALLFAARGTEDDLALHYTASTSIAALARAVFNSSWSLAFRAGPAGAATAAFSPDGTRIVTASEDKTARVWDAATASVLAVLRGPRGSCDLRRVQP